MAVPAFLLHLICRAANDQHGGAACSAGYPDLLVTPEQMSSLLGAEAASRIPARPDSANIIAWHGAQGWLRQVFDSSIVFRELGYTLDVIDIEAARGGEILVDLNRPLPVDFGRSYDLVLDTGTCEHCFHVGQAAINLASLVRPQGILIQVAPVNVFNHGFYNINPTWFHDFYPLNGFRILFFQGVADILSNPVCFDPPPFDRFEQIPERSILVMVAKREQQSEIRIPVQRKYQKNPKLGND